MDDTLPFLIADSARMFRRQLQGRIKNYGITGQQWRLLAVVQRCPGITQASAAEILEAQPITLTRMVDKLAEAGLIERHPAENDRRANALQLTEKAAPLIEVMRNEVHTLQEEVLEGFSTEDRATFTALAARFRTTLSQRSSGIALNEDVAEATGETYE